MVICRYCLGTLSPFGQYGKIDTPVRYVEYMGTVRGVHGYGT